MGSLLTTNEQMPQVMGSPPAQNAWLEIKIVFTEFYPKLKTEHTENCKAQCEPQSIKDP